MTVLSTTAREQDALVLAVDHFGKDVSTGTRNSSVKEAHVDAVLALLGERHLAGKVSNPRMAIRKLRGGPSRSGDQVFDSEGCFSIRGGAADLASGRLGCRPGPPGRG